MNFADDYTGRIRILYTSQGIQHYATYRAPTKLLGQEALMDIGPAFRQHIHNSDAVLAVDYAEQGSSVFLPITAPTGTLGAGGRTGFLPGTTNMHKSLMRTISGRSVNGSKWRFCVFNSLNAELDDFKLDLDDMDGADIGLIDALQGAADLGGLICNDSSSLTQIYRRWTVKPNDAWIARFRKTVNA